MNIKDVGQCLAHSKQSVHSSCLYYKCAHYKASNIAQGVASGRVAVWQLAREQSRGRWTEKGHLAGLRYSALFLGTGRWCQCGCLGTASMVRCQSWRDLSMAL